MVEDDKYCIDILTQVSAVTRALQAVALGLLEDHLGHCVARAVAEGTVAAAGIVRGAAGSLRRRARGRLGAGAANRDRLLMRAGMVIGCFTPWPANVSLVKRDVKVPM